MSNDEIWDKVNTLRGEAEYQDFKYGSSTYEWELGAKVCNELLQELKNINDESKIVTFMGFPIRINYHNINVIKLWREVR